MDLTASHPVVPASGRPLASNVEWLHFKCLSVRKVPTTAIDSNMNTVFNSTEIFSDRHL